MSLGIVNLGRNWGSLNIRNYVSLFSETGVYREYPKRLIRRATGMICMAAPRPGAAKRVPILTLRRRVHLKRHFVYTHIRLSDDFFNLFLNIPPDQVR